MKLGLLGYPVAHSKSPELYRRFLGDKLTSYELFSCENDADVPSLDFFRTRLDGLNITSPYKKHFVGQIEIPSPLVKSLGAVNTLAFTGDKVLGTNTDLVAIVDILKNYIKQFKKIQLLLLGDGVMARVTKLVAHDLNIPLIQFSRKLTEGFNQLNLAQYESGEYQNIIINSCSRDYVFQGKTSGNEIFWDYNYAFTPHLSSLPAQVKLYQDGQEMLELQAKAAIQFWREVNPKLK